MKGALRKIWVAVTLAIAFALLMSPAHALAQAAPSNRLVVIMDSSGSFKTRQAEALKQVVQLLDSMAQTKLHRWETDTGEIIIVAMDAIPEVVWKGSLRDLKTLEPKNWAERFKARKDLSECTDVLEAFNLAARELEGDPSQVSKYLFVFSDLIHEPPTNSVRNCARPINSPSEDFSWDKFSDVSVTLFWMPADTKLIWQRAINEHGLESNFKIYSSSQSEIEKVSPPPRPERKITEEDGKKARAQLIGLGKSVIKWFAYVLGGIIGIVVVVILIGRLRSASAGRARQGVRPVAGQLRPGSVRPIRPLPPRRGSGNQP